MSYSVDETPRTDGRSVPTRWRVVVATAIALAGAVATGAAVVPSANADTAITAAPGDRVVQQRLDGLVRDDKFPAALAAVRGRDGRTRNYTAGVADLTTGAKVPVDGQVRIASNTKIFTATVVLQLVGEGKVRLDAPIETYLPKLVRGDGIDGRNITVRQLLQHTSGLPDYDQHIARDYFAVQHTYFEPRDLIDLALAEKALFAPGTGWEYSNTNYLVAGLLVQKVTGRPISEEITNRIIKRIGLRHTYWPTVGDQTIRGRHPKGYFAAKPEDPLVDVTDMDPSMAWAAGQLIGTPSDLNRFLTALLDGELLRPEQLKQMQTTVEAPDFSVRGNARYGLGLASVTLSCGRIAWSHGGDAPGYETRNAATTDGRAAAIAVTALPMTMRGSHARRGRRRRGALPVTPDPGCACCGRDQPSRCEAARRFGRRAASQRAPASAPVVGVLQVVQHGGDPPVGAVGRGPGRAWRRCCGCACGRRPSVTTSRSAMAVLPSPSAISASTSRSRGLSRSRRVSGRVRVSSCATTSGSIAVPPSATRCSASRNSSTRPTRSLSR